jgi:hypothetical protein
VAFSNSLPKRFSRTIKSLEGEVLKQKRLIVILDHKVVPEIQVDIYFDCMFLRNSKQVLEIEIRLKKVFNLDQNSVNWADMIFLEK